MNPLRDHPQLVKHGRQPIRNSRRVALELGLLWRHRRQRGAQPELERDKPLLDAVVKIALDPPSRLIAGRDDPRP